MTRGAASISFGDVVRCLLAAIGALILISASSGADSLDERFLQGLRERRLYSLAESYCNDRLRDAQLPETARAELVIELSRTLADHAIQTPPDQRAPFWQQAHDVGGAYIRDYARSPHLPLVRMQLALAALAEGELARQEAEVSGSANLNATRSILRRAIEQLRALNDETSAELVRRSRAAAGNQAGLSVEALRSLQDEIHFQLARAYRNQAMCYESESADRINALTQAVELLRPLSEQTADPQLALAARFDTVTCERMLRHFDAAQRQLDQLDAQHAPAEAQSRIRAERIRLALDRGQTQEAITLAGRPGATADRWGAELDDARLAAYLAAWKQSNERNDDVRATEMQRAAAEQAKYIARVHAPYWMRRAETAVAQSISSVDQVANLDVLVQAAVSYYRAGKLDQAVAAYDRAADQALARQHTDDAFKLGLAAAAIDAERKHHEAAAQNYRKAALRTPSHQQAPQAHLLAIYHAGQAALAQQPPDVTEYERLLREHLERWPKSATSGQANWWLGRLLEDRHAWREAITAFQSIPPEHAQAVAAADAMERCYEQQLASLTAEGGSGEAVAREGADYLMRLVIGRQNQLPRTWTPLSRAAAVSAARLWIGYMPDQLSRAENLLREALAASPDAPAEWRTTAEALLLAAQVGQGRASQADIDINRFDGAPPATLLLLLDTLTSLSRRAKPEARRDAAMMQLRVLERTRSRTDLSEADRARLDRVRADALIEADRRGEALAAWKKLAADHPTDGSMQETYAKLLAAGTDSISQTAAAAKWQEIVDKSPAGTPRWFRAKLGVAQAELRLGHKAQARALIKLIELAYPDLGGQPLQTQFRELLRQCE